MKKAVSFIFVCMMAGMVYAQQAATTIVFNELSHDFGSIAKDGGKAEYSFEFTNTGDHPVTVQNVMGSCGCTSSGWTKEPVEPGKTGYVTVAYKPSAITTFNKSVTVKLAGGSPETIVLHIRGNVIAVAQQ